MTDDLLNSQDDKSKSRLAEVLGLSDKELEKAPHKINHDEKDDWMRTTPFG
jgi:hypothetical protein